MRKKKIWLAWLSVVVLLSLILGVILIGGTGDKSLYLIGQMTGGHAQFGLQCSSCHAKPFSGKEGLQKACLDCHAKELKEADDSHPKSKFTDPRNADRVAKLDARYCVACHVEHKPETSYVMGVTLPPDFCVTCHYDIAEDRPSHKGLEFNTCQSAGCHNFHDNRALYEDFLLKHAADKQMLQSQLLLVRNYKAKYRLDQKAGLSADIKPILAGREDVPVGLKQRIKVPANWHKTVHARAGVNCLKCHKATLSTKDWVDKPQHDVCKHCHKQEHATFLQGKHGIRLGLKLSPMTPAKARISMKKKALHKDLNCNSCHKAHQRNTRYAAVDACLACHDSRHVNNYKKSPHFNLWKKELAEIGRPGTGVSCASCHMPRRKYISAGNDYVWVDHNQNANLRPNEKMIREVCMNCHGLGFSIDSLASEQLIHSNFNGKPEESVKSIEWAKKRVKQKKKEKNNVQK